MTPATTPPAISTPSRRRLRGLEIFMRDDRSPLYRHGIVAKIVAEYIARLEKSFSCWRNRLGFMESFRISRAESGFPVFQNVLELENDRRQAEQRLANIPAGRRAARRDGRLHPAPQGISGSAAEVDGRAALSGRRQGRRRVRPVHRSPRRPRSRSIRRPCGPIYLVHWATLRRLGQPAADLYGDGGGFLRGDGRANWSTTTASSTRRSTFRCRSTACSTRSWPTASTISPKRTRPTRCRRRPSPAISTRISRRCIPSSCGASCSGRSIRPASPSTIRRSPRCCPRCARPENAWLLTWTIQEVYSKGERPGRKGLWSSEQGHAGIPHQHRRSRSRAPGRVELREACADPARGLSGALCRRRGAEDLLRLQGPHPVEGTGDQRCLEVRRGKSCPSRRTLSPCTGRGMRQRSAAVLSRLGERCRVEGQRTANED